MPGVALLAPIPARHLEAALKALTEKDFVLLGSGAYEVFRDVADGARVWIYVSHDTAEPVVRYKGVYRGVVGDLLGMRRLEKSGFRPLTTAGEKWSFYWKLAEIEKLERPVPLTDMQLATGAYLTGYPRGPLQVLE